MDHRRNHKTALVGLIHVHLAGARRLETREHPEYYSHKRPLTSYSPHRHPGSGLNQKVGGAGVRKVKYSRLNPRYPHDPNLKTGDSAP